MDKDLLRIRKVVEKEFAVFQQRFSDSLVADSKLIQDVVTFIKNKKGKQIRPMLVLLSGKLCGEINENSWRSAVALEMLHTASLLHDDVVDETLERRGHQSVNAMFGNTTAALVDGCRRNRYSLCCYGFQIIGNRFGKRMPKENCCNWKSHHFEALLFKLYSTKRLPISACLK